MPNDWESDTKNVFVYLTRGVSHAISSNVGRTTLYPYLIYPFQLTSFQFGVGASLSPLSIRHFCFYCLYSVFRLYDVVQLFAVESHMTSFNQLDCNIPA